MDLPQQTINLMTNFSIHIVVHISHQLPRLLGDEVPNYIAGLFCVKQVLSNIIQESVEILLIRFHLLQHIWTCLPLKEAPHHFLQKSQELPRDVVHHDPPRCLFLPWLYMPTKGRSVAPPCEARSADPASFGSVCTSQPTPAGPGRVSVNTRMHGPLWFATSRQTASVACSLYQAMPWQIPSTVQQQQ